MAVMVHPLAGVLPGGCTAHKRFRQDLVEVHEESHNHPHTSAEHRPFHKDRQALHKHARGSYGDRYDERNPNEGGGRYYGEGYEGKIVLMIPRICTCRETPHAHPFRDLTHSEL
jgi:hypothetical protein